MSASVLLATEGQNKSAMFRDQYKYTIFNWITCLRKSARDSHGTGNVQWVLVATSLYTTFQHMNTRLIQLQNKQGNQRWQIPRPATFQCFGNVPPIIIQQIDLFSWRHFCARSSFYIFNLIELPKKFPYKIFERNCRSSFWDIPHWIVRLAAYWRGMTALTLHYICIRSTWTYREYVCKCL